METVAIIGVTILASIIFGFPNLLPNDSLDRPNFSHANYDMQERFFDGNDYEAIEQWEQFNASEDQ